MSDQLLMPSAQQGAAITFKTGLRIGILGRRDDQLLMLTQTGYITIPVQHLLDRDDISSVRGWLCESEREEAKLPEAVAYQAALFGQAIPLTREEFDSEIEKMVKALFS